MITENPDMKGLPNTLSRSFFIDTHSHMYSEEFDGERAEAVERSKESGVCRLILPDIDRISRKRMLSFEDEFPGYSEVMVGLHPESVTEDYGKELKDIEKLLSERTFCGIGEIGIDLYWDTSRYKEQVEAFEYQLGIARDASLPVSIHSRKSIDEIFKSLRKFKGVRGVLHCFSGDTEQAKRAADMGLYIGVGGVVTFKNARLAQVVKECGIGWTVLETDAPYLAPVPFRGKRNESSYIPVIAEFIAGLTGLSVKEVARTTTQNASELFKIDL